MVSKRHIYEPLERVESAIDAIYKIGAEAATKGDWATKKRIDEIIQRDLSEARRKLEYAMEIAE